MFFRQDALPTSLLQECRDLIFKNLNDCLVYEGLIRILLVL